MAVVVLCLMMAVVSLSTAATTSTSPSAAPGKLERLKIAVAPLGWDTNYTWLQSRSGRLDKRPSLEYLIGIDRQTGAYIAELAEQCAMAPDGKSWTIRLRQGVTFHDNWGEFTAKDVRHSIFLITQPESVQTDAGYWRSLMGIGKAVWALRGSPNALNLFRIFNKAEGSVVNAYEHPYIEERHEALGKAINPTERARLLREIADHKFNEFTDMPMFWFHAEAGVNPKYIAEYTFPGSITGFFTHLEYVKPAP